MTERRDLTEDLDRLDALDLSSREGAKWYTIRCTEHIFHTLFPLDRQHRERSPVPLSRQMRGNMGARALEDCQWLPRDTVMELLACTVSAFRSIFRDPRTTLQRVEEPRSPARLANLAPRTMRWLVRQPGRTFAAKVAGKTHIPAEKKIFSADTKENRYALYLYRRLAGLAERRYALVEDRQEDWEELRILKEFLALRSQLRTSPLGDVPAQPCLQANNVLISDKEYSILWRAGRRLDQYEKELPQTFAHIQEQVMSAIYIHLLENLFTRDRVCLFDRLSTVGKQDGVLRLCTPDGQACCAANFLELDGAGRARRWLRAEYDRTHIRTGAVELRLDWKKMRYSAGSSVQRTYTVELKEDDWYEGVSMLFTDQRGKALTRYGNLSEIQVICGTICQDLLGPGARRPADRAEEPGDVCLELSLERLYYIRAGQPRDLLDLPASVAWDGGQVCAADPDGICPDGGQPVAARAVFTGEPAGARGFRETVGCLPHGGRAIYMMPDTLSEFEQEPVRRAVQGSLPRNYPVWRSVGAALFCAGPDMKEGLRPKVGDRLSVVDLTGLGSVTQLRYIRDDAGYPVFRRFPPNPLEQAEEAGPPEYCLPEFCRRYLQAYQDKYGWKLPERTVRALLEGGVVTRLLLCRQGAVVPVQGEDGAAFFHLGFDKQLHRALADGALEALRKSGLRDKAPGKLVLLADHLQVSPAQLRDALQLPGWPLLVRPGDLLAGALRVAGRLEQGLLTWEERLPDLSLEIADGYYKLFPLVRGRQMEAGVNIQRIEAPAGFTLPAGVSEIRFPLVMRDAEAVSNISAYLRGDWLPFSEPEPVKVCVHYDFSSENCCKLYFSPTRQDGPMPRSVLAECVPDKYMVRPDEALCFQEGKWQPGVTAERAAEIFTCRTDQLLRLLDQILNPGNSKAAGTLRYTAERPDVAGCHLTWLYAVNYYQDDGAVLAALRRFMDGRLPVLLYDLMTREKTAFTDWNFYQRFADVTVTARQEHATDVLRRYAIRFLAALDFRLLSIVRMEWAEKVRDYLLYELPRTYADGFVLSAVYRDMLRAREVDALVLKQVVTLGMEDRFRGNMERMLSALVWQSQDMIARIYGDWPQFIDSCLKSCQRQIRYAKWNLQKLNLLELRDYYELLLAILRLRGSTDFGRLRTGSRESLALARRIRRVDALLAEQFPDDLNDKMKLRVGIQVDQPEHLSRMSRIAFILNACLTGENGAAAITLTGFDDAEH